MFDLRQHSAHDSGKPKSVRRAGLQAATVEHYQGYRIEISERPTSPISKRTGFSVLVDGGEPLLRTYLTGFLSEKSAREAAQAEVRRLDAKYGQDESPVPKLIDSFQRQRAAREARRRAERLAKRI